MKQLLYSLLIFFFYFNSTTISQNPEWINYTNGDDINAIEMEGDFVWVGTNAGLVKINKITGNTIFLDKLNSGLPSNYVNCIAIDEFGNKWIGTGTEAWEVEGGLSKYDGSEWIVYDETNSGLRSNYINCIAIDEVGNKWIGTPDGLAKFDGTDWTIHNSGLPYNSVSCIAIDEFGNKWIGTQFGLAKFDGTNWTIYNESNSGLPFNAIECITFDKSNNVWIGTWAGLAKFDGTNWTVFDTSNSGLPDFDIASIAFDKSNNIWIGTCEGGLVKYDGSDWEVYSMENTDLPGNGISYITIDNEGFKWIGTFNIYGFENWYGKGLIKYDDTYWTKINTSSSGLHNNLIGSLAIDEAGNKWIGCGKPSAWSQDIDKTNLVKFDGIDWTIYDELNSPLPDNDINCITTDNFGNKWIGTGGGTEGGGLVKFDGTDWTIYNESNSDLPSDYIYCIAIDEVGNKWIGTPDGLVKFDGTDWTIYNTSNSGLPGNHISSIAIDASGNKWIGAWEGLVKKGLVKFDGENWNIYNTSNSDLPSNHITCITIDEIGNKWIGTQRERISSGNYIGGGLAKFDGTDWTIYDESNSDLPSNHINCIAIDNANNTWIGTGGGTEGGLVKFDGTDWIIYNESNSGLSSSLVSCITIDEYGNKWIGTRLGGLSVFNEDGIVSVEENNTNIEQIPTRYELHQNYPNPFNPSTTIKYSIPKQSNVTLKVYDVLGSEVATLVNKEQPQSNYEVTWNVGNQASGVYFYQFTAGNYVETKKMILLR